MTPEEWAAWWKARYEPYDGGKLVVCKRCRAVTTSVIMHDRWHAQDDGQDADA